LREIYFKISRYPFKVTISSINDMNTKTTIAIFASVAILAAAAIAPTFLTQASAKISPASCTNGGGNQPGGQQPACQGQGLQQNPATNPAGSAPPGQQP
jgi:hypothetical protein